MNEVIKAPISLMSPDTILPIGDVPPVVDARTFLQMMMNRMGVSYHKYGSIVDKFPHGATGLDQIKQRVDKYVDTANIEWLIDAANYCMIEALKPCLRTAHFRATDSDESPGRINLDGSVSHGPN